MSDHLASLRVAVEGGTTRTMDYDPWGNIIAGSSTGERSTFNDQERDLESGLYDLTDRNLDAVVGGFTRPDRLWEKFPWVSPYQYAYANPLRLTDPDGMQVMPLSLDPAQKILFAAGVMAQNKQKAERLTGGMVTGPPQKIYVKGTGFVDFGGVMRQPGGGSLAEQSYREQVRRQLEDGVLDAFRHAFANALTARIVGAEVTTAAGAAYEDITEVMGDNKKASKGMDNFNNSIGAQIGAANPKATDEEIYNLVMQAMKNGRLQLSPNPLPDYRALKEVDND